jgi:hypothetical protein
MRIGIAFDNSMSTSSSDIVATVNHYAKAIEFVAPQEAFNFPVSQIVFPDTVNAFVSKSAADRRLDTLLIFTTVPYENNFFFESESDVYIVSLADWNILTDIPIVNGVVFMALAIIVKYVMDIGHNHDEISGCINDFWWDKSSVDSGMRSAFICGRCLSGSHGNRFIGSKELADVEVLLDALSSASRKRQPISRKESEVSTVPRVAFLCHNSKDKPEVRLVNAALKKAGVATWLDEEQIMPGDVWQHVLERQIALVSSCIVFVGSTGIGPWQDIELMAFLTEFGQRNVRIIPAVVGSPPSFPELPIFLRQFQYIDLRGERAIDIASLVTVLLDRR